MGQLTFEFFLRLVMGWNLFLLLISRHESSEKFLNVSYRFTTGFAVVAVLGYLVPQWPQLMPPHETAWSLVAFFSLWFGAGIYLSKTSTVLRAAGFFMIVLSPLAIFYERGWGFGLNMLLSALTIGGAFMGQFLGHWFLNVPNIHIREFQRVSRVALGVLILRAFGIAIALAFLPRATELSSGDMFDLRGDYFGFGLFGLILLSARLLWGIVAPLVLTWMAKRTVDIRSTQSATGIFYANSVLVLLGEICAIYLEKALNYPM